jgi:hypothetical protein
MILHPIAGLLNLKGVIPMIWGGGGGRATCAILWCPVPGIKRPRLYDSLFHITEQSIRKLLATTPTKYVIIVRLTVPYHGTSIRN